MYAILCVYKPHLHSDITIHNCLFVNTHIYCVLRSKQTKNNNNNNNNNNLIYILYKYDLYNYILKIILSILNNILIKI